MRCEICDANWGVGSDRLCVKCRNEIKKARNMPKPDKDAEAPEREEFKIDTYWADYKTKQERKYESAD